MTGQGAEAALRPAVDLANFGAYNGPTFREGFGDTGIDLLQRDQALRQPLAAGQLALRANQGLAAEVGADNTLGDEPVPEILTRLRESVPARRNLVGDK